MRWNLRHLMAMDVPKDIRFEFQLSFSSKVPNNIMICPVVSPQGAPKPISAKAEVP